MPRRSRVAGQALILFMVAMLVLATGLVVLFNTGQTVTKKVQLVNTADAAAYSVAVQQARAMNLIAYMNRATVANEVAVAQFVSLYSWSNYVISGTDHIKKVLWVIRVAGDLAGGAGESLDPAIAALRKAERLMKKGRGLEQRVSRLVMTLVANMNGAYALASKAIKLASTADAVAEVGLSIVKKNDPKAYIPTKGLAILGQNAYSAQAYMHSYSIPKNGTSSGADRLKNVVMEARDPFSRQRNGSFLHYIHKKGGTDLVDYHDWVALDTLNFKAKLGWCPLCVKWDAPMAWGGAAAVDKIPGSFAALARKNKGWHAPFVGKPPDYAAEGDYQPYAGALANNAASGMVLRDPVLGGNPWLKSRLKLILDVTVGLPDYVDVKKGPATVPYLNGRSAGENGVDRLDVGPRFTVLVAQDMDKVDTSSHIHGGLVEGRLATPDQTIGSGLTAMSSAQVYFERSRHLMPRMFGDRREMGSLFSPYWQARLVETPCATRQAVALLNKSVAPCL
jgi:hypothetical protein